MSNFETHLSIIMADSLSDFLNGNYSEKAYSAAQGIEYTFLRVPLNKLLPFCRHSGLFDELEISAIEDAIAERAQEDTDHDRELYREQMREDNLRVAEGWE